MSVPVITVSDVSKRYRLGSGVDPDEGIRHVLERLVRAPFRRTRLGAAPVPHPASREHWALRDLNLEVNPGEVVGVIGHNGAGKSTLLKILSRVTEPTTGRLHLRGRIASLLEVGTGFHPELTGRENVFLNGAILGMRGHEIRARFDAIVAFAEVEQFLDTPVKRYSSGMFLRLAFSVAAHLNPEVLIIDEVLAVGDAQFQKKCLAKMQELSRQQGRTVLFVSHNLQAVSTLTTRCIVLRQGRKVLDGTPREAIAAYLEGGGHQSLHYSAVPSDTEPTVTRVEVLTSEPNGIHVHGEPLRVAIEVSTPRPLPAPVLHFQLVDSMLQPVVHLMYLDGAATGFCRTPGSYRLVCEIPHPRLYLGRYSVTTHFEEAYGTWVHYQTLEAMSPFEVVMHGHDRDWPWQEGRCKYVEEGLWFHERVPSATGLPAACAAG